MEFTAKNFLNYLFGTDNLNRFRNDFKTACNRNLDFNKSNLSKQELIEIIKQRPKKAKRKHARIGVVWAVGGGTASYLLGQFGYSLASSILFIMTVLFAVEEPLRGAIINAAAYTTADENMSKEELVFRKAWNSLMFRTTSLAVLLLPALLLKTGMENAYLITRELVEDWFLKDATL